MKRSLVGLVLVVLASLLNAPPALAVSPGAIFTCQFTGQVEAVDPIVSPGVTPSAHPHVFYGGGPVTSTETTATLLTKATTCVETGNHSAFWIPEVREDGVPLQPATSKHALLYYRCKHNAATCANMQPFPEDYGQVEGNAKATSAAENPAFDNGLGGFRCGTAIGTFYPTPPTTCTARILVLSVTFGNCLRNGVLTYQTNTACTTGGGQPVVRIQQFFRFQLPDTEVGTITLGGNPSYTLHSDYKVGWDPAAFENFLNLCIRVNVDCGTNPNV